MNQQSKPADRLDEKSFEAEEPVSELGPKEEAELRLQSLYEKIDTGKWGLRSEHLKRLIRKVEVGKKPSTEEFARWGTDRPISAFGNETMYVYEGFRTENIDRDHAVTHETAEALLGSGLFVGTDWKELVGQLDAGELEDTGYVRSIRNELKSLDNPDILTEKAGRAGMDPETYREWMKKRVHHEQTAEALAFYIKSGGDEQEMLALHMEHVPKESLPPEWQQALDTGDRGKVTQLYKDSGLEERNHYLFELFDKNLGKRTPEDITAQLNEIEEDEEYDELLDLELEEQLLQSFEAPAMAQPPKIKKEPSLWDMLKSLFLPKPTVETPGKFF